MRKPSSDCLPKFKSTERPQGEKKRVENIFFTIVCWFLTLFLWIFIYFLNDVYTKREITKSNFYDYYHNYPKRQKKKIAFVIIELLVYIIYIILEFNSPIFKFLRNKTNKSIKEKMSSFFKKKAIFIFNYEINSKKEKKKTNKLTHKFEYYSCRDVSGLFVLNSKEEIIKKKTYLLLEIGEEINFDNDKTKKDYNNEKENFIKKEEYKDAVLKKEKKYIDGLKKYYMIKLDNKTSSFINYIWFGVFTILVLTEFYKLFIRFTNIYQKFIIRKIVSTNNDLRKVEKYEEYNPQLDLITKEIISFNSDDFIYTSNDSKKKSEKNSCPDSQPAKTIAEVGNLQNDKNNNDFNSTNSDFKIFSNNDGISKEKNYTNS